MQGGHVDIGWEHKLAYYRRGVGDEVLNLMSLTPGTGRYCREREGMISSTSISADITSFGEIEGDGAGQ